MRILSSASALWLMLPAVAFAHEGEPLAPHDALTAWAFDPLILLGLAVSAWLYLKGATREHGIQRWERCCYWAGWWSLVIALVSPLHPMGEVLFSAHMAQHEILMLVSAPLLVLGRPLIPYVWALPLRWRRIVNASWIEGPWRWLSRPFNAWWIHALALWGWHAPVLFQATVDNGLVHGLQHLSFLLTALIFWWALIRGRDARIGSGIAVLYIFSTGVHSSILGALLTFSPRVWYPVYSATTPAWGLTPLEDQQVGGLIMWVPAGFVFLGAGLVLFARWIQQPVSRQLTTSLLLLIALTSCTPNLQLRNLSREAWELTGGDSSRGKAAVERYGCGSCHTIPQIDSAVGNVGPPLMKMALRTYIGGVLTNTPENMDTWIKNPPGVDPMTAMPNLNVSEEDRRDIVAFLYTLR